jgi:hypothetical protein
MRRATVALLVGSLLAVGAPAGWLLAGGPAAAQYGGDAAEALAPAAPAPAPAPETVTQPGPPSIATQSARLVDVVQAADPPVEVRVGGRSAGVDAVGLDAERLVVVPDDVLRVGWYQPGPAPGDDAGSAVLVGHVDDREQGLGTFAVLRDLQAGDEVVVRTASGRELVYDVLALEQFVKAEVPMERLFSSEGPPRLVLISCAGEFDPATRSYRDNVVVTAVPRA